ncbi:MAG: stage II sporulation protein M [Neisseriaceae bacterium]|nr:stage II sporulation protein M [Neisseriaceae bacterium]MBP6863081.1 stage II sporulation protein M [Neisseriaceae bacterium]
MTAPVPTTPTWRQRLCRFISTDLPATVQAEKKYVWLAHGLFFIPALSMMIWMGNDPSNFGFFANEATSRTNLLTLYRMVIEATPAQYVWMISIHLNHVLMMMIQFLVGGFLLGLGTAASLVNQGLYFGSILGLSLDLPLPWLFMYHTFYHGALELLGMMLAGASGLRIGITLLSTCLRKTDFKPGLASAFNLFLGALFFLVLTLPAGVVFYPLADAHILIKTLFNLLVWVGCYAYLFWPRTPSFPQDPSVKNHS